MSPDVRSVLVGTAGLTVAAVVALVLTVAGGRDEGDASVRVTARLAAGVAFVQAAHFAEELATSFYRRFPESLGLTPWSASFFVSFNLVWLAVWALSVLGLVRRRRAALFPLWFLAIGCLANGVAHPLLGLRAGGYFPGLVTSPFAGAAGVLLLRGLGRVTGTERR